MPLLLDISGFEALFQVNYQPLCVTSYRIVQDKAVAEDIVQDVFAKLWEKRETLTINSSLKAYLIQSTINQSLNYLKKYKNALSRESFYSSGADENANTTEQAIALREVSKRADQAIRSLPDACRTVFILSRYEQMSYKQIAEKLNISVKTVENQMTKALKYLRKCLLTLALLIIFFSQA